MRDPRRQRTRSRSTEARWPQLIHDTFPTTRALMVKTLFERQADLVLAHRESANMTLENQTIGASPVPWHPGTIRFFKEKGITPR